MREQLWLHAVPEALQANELEQAAVVGAAQAPAPSQIRLLSSAPVQLGVSQGVVEGGKTQAPVASQSLAPQPRGSPEAHVVAQQWPFPETPQTPVRQESPLVQAVPAASWTTQEPLGQ